MAKKLFLCALLFAACLLAHGLPPRRGDGDTAVASEDDNQSSGHQNDDTESSDRKTSDDELTQRSNFRVRHRGDDVRDMTDDAKEPAATSSHIRVIHQTSSVKQISPTEFFDSESTVNTHSNNDENEAHAKQPTFQVSRREFEPVQRLYEKPHAPTKEEPKPQEQSIFELDEEIFNAFPTQPPTTTTVSSPSTTTTAKAVEITTHRPEEHAAQIILETQLPKTLDEIYHLHDIKSNSTNNQQQILLYLKFVRDFSKWNPRSSLSELEWATTSTHGSELARNAAFELVNQTKQDGKDDTSFVKLISLPFMNDFYNEGFIVTKKNYSVSNEQRIVGRLKFACKTVGIDQHPFNATDVIDAHDDPRLANCAFRMTNADDNQPQFYVTATNKGVWANYEGDGFRAKRRIAIRASHDSVVDAAIELDGRLSTVNFYLNGYKVWTINAVGAPPPNDGVTKVDYGQVTTPTLTTISNVQFSFGTSKCLDQSDPNNRRSQDLLVRIASADDKQYPQNAVFVDGDKVPSNIAWGQGSIMSLYKLIIIEQESLPGVLSTQM